MKYELVYILTPKLTEDEAKKEADLIGKKLTEKGAKIERQDFWGKKKLAYQIKKLDHGYYVLVVFESESEVPVLVEKMFHEDEKILRTLIVKYEEGSKPFKLGETAVGSRKRDAEKIKKESQISDTLTDKSKIESQEKEEVEDEKMKAEAEMEGEANKDESRISNLESRGEEKGEKEVRSEEKEASVKKEEDKKENRDKEKKSGDEKKEDVDVKDLDKRLDEILGKI